MRIVSSTSTVAAGWADAAKALSACAAVVAASAATARPTAAAKVRWIKVAPSAGGRSLRGVAQFLQHGREFVVLELGMEKGHAGTVFRAMFDRMLVNAPQH